MIYYNYLNILIGAQDLILTSL